MGKLHFFITLAGTYPSSCRCIIWGWRGRPGAIRNSRSGLSAETAAAADVHDLCGDHHDVAQFIFVINLFLDMFKGPKAATIRGKRPRWSGPTATPPPHDNFGGVTPVVNHGTV